MKTKLEINVEEEEIEYLKSIGYIPSLDYGDEIMVKIYDKQYNMNIGDRLIFGDKYRIVKQKDFDLENDMIIYIIKEYE